jgi:hypothetical protein
MYWQLVLPADEHLLASPVELTPEFGWRWFGLGWGRQPTWDQADLEKWSGAATTDALPDATNRYLFSSIASPTKFAAKTANRWQIVLLSSAVALAIGLLLLYVPGAARPAALLAIGAFMLVLSAFLPDIALLFSQAAVLGLFLILLAYALRNGLSRRRAAGRVIPGAASSIMERGSSIRRKPRAVEMAGAPSGSSVTETLDLPAAGSQHA